MDIMLMLGSYQFGLNTAAFQELNRNTEWRWPSQDVFNKRPVLQFTGWGEDSITLPGIIYPEYWGGTHQLDDLRALGDTGQPQMLIDGRGNVLGQWVITNVGEKQGTFAPGGGARRQEFTVSLKRYQDDGKATVATAAQAAATGDASTATGQAGSVVASAAAKMSQVSSAMANAANNVKNLVSSVVTPLQGTLNSIGQSMAMAQQVVRAANEAKAAIKAVGSINSLTTAQSALGGLMRAASNGATVAARASKSMNGTLATMQAAGEPSAAIATVKAAIIDVNKAASAAAGIRAQAENIVRVFS